MAVKYMRTPQTRRIDFTPNIDTFDFILPFIGEFDSVRLKDRDVTGIWKGIG